ncbi:unnamed protein product [Coregonus sp. 'balchen']|nr:unnamed protein product [Coregonus sp. 'balchen']
MLASVYERLQQCSDSVQPRHLTELETWHYNLTFEQVTADALNLEEDPEDVRQGVHRYLVYILSEDREQEVVSIIS